MQLELMPLINRVARAQLRRGGARFRNLVAHGHEVHFIDQPGSDSGPTVALLHGLGSSAFAFSQVIPGIARHARRVIAVDLPGTGFSPVPAKPPGIETCVRLLAALYERELAGQGAVLVGNSLGGAMAAELAGRFPQLARAVMLIAPAGAKVTAERFKNMVQGFELKSWVDGRALMRRLYGSPPPIIPELLAQDMFVNLNRPHVRELLVGERPSDFLEPEYPARAEDAGAGALGPQREGAALRGHRVLPQPSCPGTRASKRSRAGATCRTSSTPSRWWSAWASSCASCRRRDARHPKLIRADLNARTGSASAGHTPPMSGGANRSGKP